MDKQALIDDLKSIEAFFNKSTGCLSEADSQFKPKEELRTVSQVVAHTALTVDWIMEGAFGKDGFKMDFEEQEKKVQQYTSLSKAREWFGNSMKNAVEIVSGISGEELEKTINDTQLMGAKPRWAMISIIAEHTAHHRGVLTMYSRLLGKVPEMPY